MSLKVVNDVAERGVKLITDFNNLFTKDEEQKQYILQVVHKCQMLYPDVSKNTLSKPLEWIIHYLSFLKMANDTMSLSFFIEIH